MTIICYKDGIMAADGLQCRGQQIVGRDERKIARLADGTLIGCCGDAVVIQRFFQFVITIWANNWMGASSEAPVVPLDWSNVGEDEFCAIAAQTDGAVFKVYNRGEIYRCRAEEKQYAIGSAHEYAHGMMLAGASAERAVRLCCDNHVYCGGIVQVEHLRPQAPDYGLEEQGLFDDGNGIVEAEAAWGRNQRDKSWAERSGLK